MATDIVDTASRRVHAAMLADQPRRGQARCAQGAGDRAVPARPGQCKHATALQSAIGRLTAARSEESVRLALRGGRKAPLGRRMSRHEMKTMSEDYRRASLRGIAPTRAARKRCRRSFGHSWRSRSRRSVSPWAEGDLLPDCGRSLRRRTLLGRRLQRIYRLLHGLWIMPLRPLPGLSQERACRAD